MKKLLRTGVLTLVMLAFVVTTLFFTAVANDAAAATAKVYMSTGSEILRANLDGSDLENVSAAQPSFPKQVLSINQSRGLQLDAADGKMYWMEKGSLVIRRANMDGLRGQTLLDAGDGLDGLEGMALDLTNRKIYWSNRGAILRANMGPGGNGGAGSRTDIEVLYDPVAVFPATAETIIKGIALDVDGGKIYWIERENNFDESIQQANLELQAGETPSTRTDLETVIVFNSAGSSAGLLDLALDLTPGAEKIYYSVTNGSPFNPSGNIEWADLTSGLPAVRVPLTPFEPSAPYEIALDLEAGEIYWSEPGAGRYRKANLDGTGVHEFAAGLNTPRGIAIDLDGQPEFEGTLADNTNQTATDQAGAGAVTNSTEDGSLVLVTAPNAISNPDAPIEDQVPGGVVMIYERVINTNSVERNIDSGLVERNNTGNLALVAIITAGVYIQPGALFGAAAAISPDGTKILVGAPGEDCLVDQVFTLDCGAAYTFSQQPDGTYLEGQKLVSPDPVQPVGTELGHRYGELVALTNDSAAIASTGADTSNGIDAGEVSMYNFSQTTQTLEFDTNLSDLIPVGASNVFTPDLKIRDISLSADITGLAASAIAVSANAKIISTSDAFLGEVVVLKSNSPWAYNSTIYSPEGVADDGFATSVSISDGRLVIGAPTDSLPVFAGDPVIQESGSAYVYTIGQLPILEAKIKPSEPKENGLFGASLSIVNRQLLVGSPGAQEAVLFTRNSPWTQQNVLLPATPLEGGEFGASVALSEQYAVVGEPATTTTTSGSADAFVLPDSDGDGLSDGADNCPSDANPGQEDTDEDGSGDVCDPCPLDLENDADGDGVCEIDDNCPNIGNPNQADEDVDGIGDVCDFDTDNDGVDDNDDNCPLEPNPGQEDSDGDGIGDTCDTDADGDGVVDGVDACLFTPGGEIVNFDGCSIWQLCPCDSPWKNHGAYVKCVSRASNDFVSDGLITGEEKGDIVSEAAQSSCGK